MSIGLTIDCRSQNSIYLSRNRMEDAYFKDIRRYPVLSKEEETELVDTYRNGKTEKEREDAKKRLVESNLRFVVAVVKRLGTPDIFMDLVSEGNVGLIRAVEKFDPSRNCRLISYALSWIIVKIQNYVINKKNTVIPPNAAKLYNYAKSAKNKFFMENQRNPTAEELSEIMKEKFNFKIDSLEDVELGHVVSIDEKYGSTDDKTVENSEPYTSRTSTNNVQKFIDDEYKKQKIGMLLGRLSPKEKYIVERYYGIDCEEESFSTISLDLELTQERVRQLYRRAIDKLQIFNNTTKKRHRHGKQDFN